MLLTVLSVSDVLNSSTTIARSEPSFSMMYLSLAARNSSQYPFIPMLSMCPEFCSNVIE